jgi:mono/diheme cytochrome c family protein
MKRVIMRRVIMRAVIMVSGTIMRSMAALLSAAMTLAAAAEQPVSLKQAPGVDKVEANCAACHSLDYVQMNSPFLNAAGWDAEVAKMINAFGAPINQADAKTIADYLKANYGP